MELFVAVLLVAFFLAARASLSVEKPGALQHVIEHFTRRWTRRARRSSATTTGDISLT